MPINAKHTARSRTEPGLKGRFALRTALDSPIMYRSTIVPIPLRVGDELRVPGVPVHVMTYVGPLGAHGEDVLDAPKGNEAWLVHLTSVLSSSIVLLGQRGPESYEEQRAVRERAIYVLGTRNNPLGPNCEHIASYVRTGVAESPQLRGAGLLSLIGIGLFALAG
jgi:hypothetical protein